MPYIVHGALCLGRGNIEYGGAALSERESDLYPQNTERDLEKTSLCPAVL